MPKVIPEEWRLLRGLLRILGLGALAAITLSVLSDPPWARGPLPLSIALYVGSPVPVVAAAMAARHRWSRARVPAGLVGALAAVAFVANVGLVLLVHHYNHELRDTIGRTCGTIAKCQRLASDKFGSAHPQLPEPPSVAGYAFRSGSESGQLLMLSYGPAPDGPTIVFVVTRRRPGGFEPPADEAQFVSTSSGKRYVETGDGDRVTRVDWWDGLFHYAVSLQGSYDRSSIEYQRATALIDSAQPF